jgi:preprotein translocase subunit SecD
MKNTTLSLLLVLFLSACSHKTESSVAPGSTEFSIAAGDVVTTSVEAVTGRRPSSPTQEMYAVRVTLSGAKSAAFRQFTKDHLNQEVQIMIGTNVVQQPVIRAEISSPKIELMFSSPDEARAIADSLSKK